MQELEKMYSKVASAKKHHDAMAPISVAKIIDVEVTLCMKQYGANTLITAVIVANGFELRHFLKADKPVDNRLVIMK